nr:MAG TPA: hypothetical protein [Caudoviricetes sp.]
MAGDPCYSTEYCGDARRKPTRYDTIMAEGRA